MQSYSFCTQQCYKCFTIILEWIVSYEGLQDPSSDKLHELSLKLSWSSESNITNVTLNLKKSLAVPKILPIFSINVHGEYRQTNLVNLKV